MQTELALAAQASLWQAARASGGKLRHPNPLPPHPQSRCPALRPHAPTCLVVCGDILPAERGPQLYAPAGSHGGGRGLQDVALRLSGWLYQPGIGGRGPHSAGTSGRSRLRVWASQWARRHCTSGLNCEAHGGTST